jgi:hypothetical protein
VDLGAVVGEVDQDGVAEVRDDRLRGRELLAVQDEPGGAVAEEQGALDVDPLLVDLAPVATRRLDVEARRGLCPPAPPS